MDGIPPRINASRNPDNTYAKGFKCNNIFRNGLFIVSNVHITGHMKINIRIKDIYN